MKRTSATVKMASKDCLQHLYRLPRVAQMTLAVAFLSCAAVMFGLGRSSSPSGDDLLESVQAIGQQLRLQQREVDRLSADSRQGVKALAARLAELQAASTRLDALGERLAQMGQLSLDEFDFSAPAPVGGPEEYEAIGNSDEDQLNSAIDALSAKLRRQSSQLDALQFLMVNRQLENDLTPSGWPVRKGWISSRYGERSDPFTGERVQHKGLDFAGTRGTQVLSVASGVVIRASKHAAYGNMVEIDHGNGYRTRYAHNQELAVKPGDHVTAGQVIALMGSTGRASAPHVHFEVLKNGSIINPSSFVSNLR
ncbi:MAG TPA: peptidoglycan DD-metalloendopeptidase family protein [Xanthomonadales bacterium]|nr:peptidoglycan DD-metalloendopeptidase family protein [Xanthomonadales bacterium]